MLNHLIKDYLKKKKKTFLLFLYMDILLKCSGCLRANFLYFIYPLLFNDIIIRAFARGFYALRCSSYHDLISDERLRHSKKNFDTFQLHPVSLHLTKIRLLFIYRRNDTWWSLFTIVEMFRITGCLLRPYWISVDLQVSAWLRKYYGTRHMHTHTRY